VRNVELTKDEETQEKDNKISDLVEQLKQTQEHHDKYVVDKDNEIANMKDEFQLELDQNNEFVLNHINVLKQELADSRLVFVISGFGDILLD
jgi:hypothetical protein